MSLLIKALQKAEQGKRSEETISPDANDLSLELAPLHPEPRLQEAAPAEPTTSAVAGNAQHINQQAASAMFKAKAAQPKNYVSKRTAIIVGVSLILLLCIGAGFYSYLESLQQPALVAIKRPAPPASANIPPDVNTQTLMPVAVPVAVPASDDQPIDGIAIDTPVAAEARSRNTNESASQPRLRPSPAQPLTFGEPVASIENNPVRITRNEPAAAINPAVQSAYEAYMAGNDATAQSLYWQALRSDVRNMDALLGMAAIAARQGRKDDAAGWYDKVLEVEPRNTVAQAGMIALLSGADPVTNESRIKNLLAQKPQSANLHAALGNLYAEQNQWPAAQQAYFDAYRFDNDNAEYAFNLAISLDHLGKSSLALQYYKETQALLVNSATTNIDRAQLQSRIAQLQ